MSADLGDRTVTIEPAPPDDPVAEALMRAMFADLDVRYADLPEDPPPTIDWFLGSVADSARPPTGTFVIARLDDDPVGCGGVVPLYPAEQIGELTRVYVEPRARGLGLSRAMLRVLEAEAGALGYRRLQLETGKRQPEAIELYRSAGWTQIERYGRYADDPLSTCFAKDV